jgi:hypothetical protein
MKKKYLIVLIVMLVVAGTQFLFARAGGVVVSGEVSVVDFIAHLLMDIIVATAACRVEV